MPTQLPYQRTIRAEQLPHEIYIEVTNHCNSLCISCPLTYDAFLQFEPKHHLSWEGFRRIVDQLPRIDRAVLHCIGELLLNRDLPRFIAHLKDRNAKVLFNTNGILLDQTRSDALVAANLDELRVSIDAVTAELYTQLRGVNQLPRIIRNLKAFIKRNGGFSQPRVSLWMVGMQANLEQLPDFIRLGAEIGVPEVYMQRLVYYGNGFQIDEETTMTAEQALFRVLETRQEELINECEKLATELGLEFKASGATTPFESVVAKERDQTEKSPWQNCWRPWKLMYITTNGTALPCCIAPFATVNYQSIILGNVLQQPLAEVWNGEQYQDLRLAVLGNSPAPWPCQYCGVKWSL